jgi:hypothetical protein
MNRQQLEKTHPPLKLNGYRAWHRNTWLLISTGKLSMQALVLYQFLIDQADFDTSHRNFGYVEINQDQIGIIFKKKSLNTIRSWLNELIQIGFLIKTNRKNVYKIVELTRYISPGRMRGQATEYSKQEKNQSIEFIIQNIASNTQTIEQETQSDDEIYELITQDDNSIAISSSKVKSNGCSHESLSDEELEILDQAISNKRVIEN